jgi:hypothetical protein
MQLSEIPVQGCIFGPDRKNWPGDCVKRRIESCNICAPSNVNRGNPIKEDDVDGIHKLQHKNNYRKALLGNLEIKKQHEILRHKILQIIQGYGRLYTGKI